MNLLIDMGNTRVKWAVSKNHHIIAGQALANQQLDRQQLIALWKSIVRPQHIAIACVSAGDLFTLVQSVANELWPGVNMLRVNAQDHAFGVTNAYPQPEKLGVDRWLTLVAARQHYALPACIVDCGTAITVDLLAAQGEHQGGFISPGLRLMRQSLAQGTDALSFSDTLYALQPAVSTEAAIYSGTLLAAIGLIEQVLKKQPDTTRLILTGGDAGLVAEQLVTPLVIDTDLVLRGLAIVLEGVL